MAKIKKKEGADNSIEEIKRLAAKADAGKGLELGFTEESEIEFGFDLDKLKDTQDPDRSHRLYYSIRSLMMQNLPKGKEHKKLRDFVYEEKNDFLNRGNKKNAEGIRNSDGRMTYISSHLEVAFDAVFEWIKEGGNAYDCYDKFRALNKEYDQLVDDEEGDEEKE